MASPARIHILVSGQVQGVYFRENTRKKAEELGISGWVRNMLDGRVEIMAEGNREKLEELARWAEQGPAFAKVDDLQTDWPGYKGDLGEFQIKY
jgi:acylphosphatase